MNETMDLKSQQLEIERLRKRVAELEEANANSQQAQNELIANERNLSAFFNTIDHLLFVLDGNGNILLTNDTVTRKLGYATEELAGQSVLMVHPPERREEAGRIVGEMLAGKADYCPVPLITKDGRQIPVETRVMAGKWSGQDVIFGVTKDLSDIKASEEKFSKAFQASPALMAISEVEIGRYLDVNESFLQTLGYTRDEIIGRTSLELNLFANPGQRALILDRMKHDGYVRNAEIIVHAKSGEIRHGLFSVEFIQLQDKKLLLTVMNDITDLRLAEEALHQSRAQLEAFFAQSLDGFFFMMLDEPVQWDDTTDKEAALDYIFAHQRVTRINEAMLAQYNTTREQFIGRTPNDLFAHDIKQGRQIWRKFFDEGHLHIDTDERKFDGTPMWMEGDYVCMRDAAGRIAGHFGIQRDVTTRKQAEEALREAEEKYRMLFEKAPIGIFQSTPEGKFIKVNQTQADIYGYSSPEEMAEQVHDIKQQLYADPAARETFKLRMAEKGVINGWVDKSLRKDGSVIWISRTVRTVKGDQGEILYYEGFTQDITNRKQAEEALREAEARWQFALSGSGDGVWDWNIQTGHVFYSKQWKAMLGYAEDEIGDTSDEWEKHVHPNDLAYANDELNKHIEGQTPVYTCEYRIRCKNGEYKWILDRGKVMECTDDGKPLRVIGTHTDITARKQTEEQLRAHLQEIEQLQDELREQAVHDPLTGLHNRRHLSEMLAREISRAEREKQSISVIVSDIDHFKKINDTCGHPVGDSFLVKIAGLLRKHARRSDIVCRYGGEEFLLILSGATAKSALKRAEEIRQKCADIRILHEKKEVQVTMSMGVATYPIHGKSTEELLVKADKALYRSKRSGRNKVTVWEE